MAVRDKPCKIKADLVSQLTSVDNYVAWTEAEVQVYWRWDAVWNARARAGTIWELVPAGCQFRHGLAKSIVKALKLTLKHMIGLTLISKRPTTLCRSSQCWPG